MIVRYAVDSPLPLVSATLGAAGITDSSAWLRGSLTSTGASATQLHSVWGTTDAGTGSLAAWGANTYDFGTQPVGTYSNQIGVTADTHYVYRFRAQNDAGAVWSGLAEFDTAITAAPAALTATAIDGASIGLTWTDTSSTETAFVLNYTNDAGSATLTLPANNTSRTVSGLTRDVAHAFRIAATNGAGLGPWSSWATATPAGKIDTGWTYSGTGNWSDGAKWSGGVPQQVNDVARLATGGATTVIDVSGVTVAQLINDRAYAHWVIGKHANSHPLTLQTATPPALIRAQSGVDCSVTVNPDVVLASDLTVQTQGNDAQSQTVNLNGALTGTGSVTLQFGGGGANRSLAINVSSVNAAGSLTVQGNRANNDAVATVGAIGSAVTTLTKKDTCTLVLTGANAQGATVIQSNAVKVRANKGLGSGDVSLIPGATANGNLPQIAFESTLTPVNGGIDTIADSATLTLQRSKNGSTYYYSTLLFNVAGATERVGKLVFRDNTGALLAEFGSGVFDRTTPAQKGIDFSQWFSVGGNVGAIEIGARGTVIMLR